MRGREFHYRWEFDLNASPQALWPFVADTNRFNRDAGLPSLLGSDVVESSSAPETLDDGAPKRRLRISKFGVGVAWEEEPFEWLRPLRFGVVRRYTSGPVAEMRVHVELTARDTGGTHLVYQVWARPRNLLGQLAIPVQIGILSARKFAQLFRHYDQLASNDSAAPAPELSTASQLNAGARARLARLETALAEQGAPPEIVSRLVETVERADDLTLVRLRPYALADYWRAPRRAVLETCLKAARVGLLDFRWDLLCPMCRGASQSSMTLKEVTPEAHCDSCRISYTVNFDRSVELTFRPNAAVREIRAREFCVGGPQITPHIVAQQKLRAGDERTLTPMLELGRHRLRVAGLPGEQLIYVGTDGETSTTLLIDGTGWPDDELQISPQPTLRVENATEREQIVVIERMAWNDQAATAADVTALQLFRDLFATEALRPGDQISVGSMTLLFTDLRGSTRLYHEIGDAVAFGAVMNHFDVLRECIAEEGGSIIKTIGDAVMAVFRQPALALRAALRAQAMLAAPPEGTRPLYLKAGIHIGPCIAVTLNERLDYFGSNVNIAARLEPLSTGEDIVISSAVLADPEVAALLSEAGGRLHAAPIEAALKGFDAMRFELWRVTKTEAQEEKKEVEKKEEAEIDAK